jgi:subtilisin-like proprotein convertase family protein
MRFASLALGWVALAAASTALAVPVSFPGNNTGVIPDADAVGRAVSFNVSGLATPVASVVLAMNLTHSYAGDLTATLISPSGVARLIILGRPGAGRTNSFGDSTNLGGTYTFNDLGRVDLIPTLQLLGELDILASGTFRTTSRGAPGRSDAGGCPTSLRGVFAGLTPAQANGIWTLVLTDSVVGDVGSVGTATLTLDTVSPTIFANGFENPVVAAPDAFANRGVSAPAHCINKVQGDYTGDGLTDFAVARANGTNINWFIRENMGGGTANTTVATFSLGNPTTDFIDSADLDGDRIADPLVWTPGAAGVAAYRARLSSRNGEVRTVILGQTDDDPTQSGDYDGDGIDDLAYFRIPSTSGPIFLQFLRSSDGALGSVQTGVGASGSQFSISGWDYNGDGLADIVVQRPDPVTPTQARFDVFDTTGAAITTFVFAQTSDFLIPGNHTGSAPYDFTTSRAVAGNREWRTRDSQTGTELPVVTYGITGDTRLGGDYDGDGQSDYAFWRASAAAGTSTFQVRPSSNTTLNWTLNFGEQGDFAIASSRVE